MKKNVLVRMVIVITLSFFFLSNLFANDPMSFSSFKKESNFAWGPIASFHFNKLYLNNNFTSSFEPGFEGGIFLRLGKKVYVQPEFLYSFRQTNFEVLLNEVQTNIDAENHYVILPVLLGYKILNGENSNIHFIIGPKFAYRVATNKPQVNDLLKPFEYGCEIGGGFDVWIFTLDLSYNFYFSRSNSNSLSEGILHQSMYNASLGIKL